LAFQQLPEEARGGMPIAPGLHEDVDHVAVLSTARQRYCWRPWILTINSSRYHVSPIWPRRRRSDRSVRWRVVGTGVRIVFSGGAAYAGGRPESRLDDRDCV